MATDGSKMAAFIFDLDGTLIDSDFAHVLAWQKALEEAHLPVDAWRIHRRIGMRDGLFLYALSDEVRSQVSPAKAKIIEHQNREQFAQFAVSCRPLRGATALFTSLGKSPIPMAGFNGHDVSF